ncbi:MAG: PEP/pyruvate-binding domain-containing protein [Desulfobaccales bacterium]
MFSFLRTVSAPKGAPQELLRERYAHFRRLLKCNNRLLALMADLEERGASGPLPEEDDLYRRLEELGEETAEMITALQRLSGDRYPQLSLAFQSLWQRLQRTLEGAPEIPDTPYLLPLHALSREQSLAVGQKMARLGEIRHRLGLPVPRGFAVTTAAYQAFMRFQGLDKTIAARLAAVPPEDTGRLTRVCEEIQQLILDTPLPPDLEGILHLAAQALPAEHLAVRSSAVGEDGEHSFAGQFTTLLNVPVAELPLAYKRVIAGKFNPAAVVYWRRQGYEVGGLPMAVGVLSMVAARASGVMFTVDPRRPEEGTLIINAVWGLGKYAVDGVITPDLYCLERETGRLSRQEIAFKPVALRLGPEGGCVEEALHPELAAAPCLSPAELARLRDLALALERHFGGPQDVEWALDESGHLVILQSRPLRLERERESPVTGPAPDLEPLLSGGVCAVGGAGAGPVYLYPPQGDPQAVPMGAVLVAAQPSLRLALVLDRLAALVLEVGSPTDHLTILAREYQVPTLVGLKGAARRLTPGEWVTVDADRTRIYPGRHPVVAERPRRDGAEGRERSRRLRYRQVLRQVVPLHLLDPHSPEFRPENCRSVHDLTRFCHEKAMEAMFTLEVGNLGQMGGVRRLQADLPFTLLVLDLEGGTTGSDPQALREEEITHLPLRALLQGFRHPGLAGLSRAAPDLSGFLSIVANTVYDPAKAEGELGDASFALIAEHYLHFSSRLGYHFALVDAYLGPESNDNYLAVQFQGGAASGDRRARRLRLLTAILTDLGFEVELNGELLQARLVKPPQEEGAAILKQVACLLAFCRQLDVALTSETALEHYLDAFRRQEFPLAL